MAWPAFDRRHVVAAAQLAVAAGLIALLWHAVDGREAARLLRRVEPGWLVAAFAALTLQTVLSALRWRLTCRQLGIGLTVPHAIGEYYLSQVVNQSLPGGMVGDAGRAVRARSQAGLVRAGLSVVFERLAGQVVLFALMAGAFVVTWAVPGGLDWPRWVSIPVGTAIAAGIAALPVALLSTTLPGPLGRTAESLLAELRTALLAAEVLPRQLALSVGTTACNLAAFACCAAAVGAPLSFAATVALVPLILFTMLIPLSVSGWGLREGAAAALFPLAGETAVHGLAASVAFGLVFLATVLPGLVPLLLRRRRRTAEAEA